MGTGKQRHHLSACIVKIKQNLNVSHALTVRTSWLWALTWFWSCSGFGIYMYTEKTGYVYPRIHAKYWEFNKSFWWLQLICTGGCDAYFLQHKQKNETTGAYCRLSTTKCQHCIAPNGRRKWHCLRVKQGTNKYAKKDFSQLLSDIRFTCTKKTWSPPGYSPRKGSHCVRK